MRDELKPLADEDWPEAVADLRHDFAGRLNVYRVMAHHPALLAAWAPLRKHVVRDRAMTDQQSEVVILRTGHNLGSRYELAHHISRGRATGMDDARITALQGPLERIEGEDGVLAGAVDALFATSRLDADSRAAVTGLIGAKGLLDLMATVGFYSVLGFIVNSFDTPVDSAVAAELDAQPLSGAS